MRRTAFLDGGGQFPPSAGAAPARVVRSHAPGLHRGSARGHYGPLPGAGWPWAVRRWDLPPKRGPMQEW